MFLAENWHIHTFQSPILEKIKAQWDTGMLSCGARYIMETIKGDKHFPQVSDPYPKFSVVEISPIVSHIYVVP